MPYVARDRRKALGEFAEPRTSGELNYQLTTKITAYLKDHKLSYSTINDILGALEGAKMEFYRRVAVPYEEKKIMENGDVYDI
jgi:hypothetical protein